MSCVFPSPCICDSCQWRATSGPVEVDDFVTPASPETFDSVCHFELDAAGEWGEWSDAPMVQCWACDHAFHHMSWVVGSDLPERYPDSWANEDVGCRRNCPNCHSRCQLKIRRAKAKRWLWAPAEGESL